MKEKNHHNFVKNCFKFEITIYSFRFIFYQVMPIIAIPAYKFPSPFLSVRASSQRLDSR